MFSCYLMYTKTYLSEAKVPQIYFIYQIQYADKKYFTNSLFHKSSILQIFLYLSKHFTAFLLPGIFFALYHRELVLT